ncbi:unnamed protein product, partial [Notodromas monacha]
MQSWLKMLRLNILAGILFLNSSSAHKIESTTTETTSKNDWQQRLDALTNDFEEQNLIVKQLNNIVQNQETMAFEMKEDLRVLKISMRNFETIARRFTNNDDTNRVLEYGEFQQKLGSITSDNEKRFHLNSLRVQKLENELKEALESMKPAGDQENAVTVDAEVLRTCADLKRQKAAKSGLYNIDPDDNDQGQPSFEVFCNATSGETVIHHDLVGEFTAKNCRRGRCQEAKNITYGNLSMLQMEALINHSEKCYQEIVYHCFGAPLHNKDMSTTAWWIDRFGQKQMYFHGTGTDAEKPCTCSQQGDCIDIEKKCNCDSRAPEWQKDHGTISNKSSLPVTQLVFKGLKFSSQKAHFTLGPLRCSGYQKSVPAKNSVTSCTDV